MGGLPLARTAARSKRPGSWAPRGQTRPLVVESQHQHAAVPRGEPLGQPVVRDSQSAPGRLGDAVAEGAAMESIGPGQVDLGDAIPLALREVELLHRKVGRALQRWQAAENRIQAGKQCGEPDRDLVSGDVNLALEGFASGGGKLFDFRPPEPTNLDHRRAVISALGDKLAAERACVVRKTLDQATRAIAA